MLRPVHPVFATALGIQTTLDDRASFPRHKKAPQQAWAEKHEKITPASGQVRKLVLVVPRWCRPVSCSIHL